MLEIQRLKHTFSLLLKSLDYIERDKKFKATKMQ